MADEKTHSAPIQNTTSIGTVTGQVHTGSGNINVEMFQSATVVSKEQLISLLGKIREELTAARKAGLEETVADDAETEIGAAERELKREAPEPSRVVDRLESAEKALQSAGKVASAATSAFEVVQKLGPYLQAAVRAAQHLF